MFFCPEIYHLGPWWKKPANGCHRCIRNEFSKWVGTHEILQLNGMSKIWQKKGFDRGKPYPKKKKKKRILFCPQIYHLGTWRKQEANGCHRCIRNEFSKWVGTHEILQLNGMSNILQKHGFDRGKPYPKKKKKREREFHFAPKYIIWDPGGDKKQTDAIVASGTSFRSGQAAKYIIWDPGGDEKQTDAIVGSGTSFRSG